MDQQPVTKRRKWDVTATGAPVAPHSIPAAGGVALPVTANDAVLRAQMTAAALLSQHASQAAAAAKPAAAAPASKAEIVREVVINNAAPAARMKLTKRPVQEDIQRRTNTVVVTKGRYYPPNMTPTEDNPPLYLRITPGAGAGETDEQKQAAVDAAAEEIERTAGLPVSKPTRQQVPQQQPELSAAVPIGFEAPAEFDTAGRVRGPGDSFLSHIMCSSGATVVLRGKGAGPGFESPEPLAVVITGPTPESVREAKRQAADLVATVCRAFEQWVAQAAAAAAKQQAVAPVQQAAVSGAPPTSAAAASAAPYAAASAAPYAAAAYPYGYYPPPGAYYHPPPAGQPYAYPYAGTPAYAPAWPGAAVPPYAGAAPYAAPPYGSPLPAYGAPQQGYPPYTYQPQPGAPAAQPAGAPAAAQGLPAQQQPQTQSQQPYAQEHQRQQQRPSYKATPPPPMPAQPAQDNAAATSGTKRKFSEAPAKGPATATQQPAALPAYVQQYAGVMGPPPPRTAGTMGPPPPRPPGSGHSTVTGQNGAIVGLVDYDGDD